MNDQTLNVPKKTMPDCCILPVLAYPDVAAAIEWLCNTFGFQERWRVGSHRAQLIYNGGVVVVIGLAGETAETPASAPATHSLLMQVADVDAHYEHVLSKGAQIQEGPTDQFYGERQYVVLDPGGHSWTISQTVREMAPETWGASCGPGI